jgi:hypothetical protein
VDYGMIGKIEKAKRYAEQPERMQFEQFTVTVDGDNNPHTVIYAEGRWQCDCNFFASRGVCSHTMALERILGEMLPSAAAVPQAF